MYFGCVEGGRVVQAGCMQEAGCLWLCSVLAFAE